MYINFDGFKSLSRETFYLFCFLPSHITSLLVVALQENVSVHPLVLCFFWQAETMTANNLCCVSGLVPLMENILNVVDILRYF